MKRILTIFACLTLALTSMAQDKTKNFVSMEVEDFEEAIHHRNVTLIDVRSAKEYEADHIDGAINVEWGNNFAYNLQKAKIKKSQKLAIYCHSGRRSKAAARWLSERGYRVVELNTGIIGWKQANKLLVHSWTSNKHGQ